MMCATTLTSALHRQTHLLHLLILSLFLLSALISAHIIALTISCSKHHPS